MLPRVGAALTQLISPISTSQGSHAQNSSEKGLSPAIHRKNAKKEGDQKPSQQEEEKKQNLDQESPDQLLQSRLKVVLEAPDDADAEPTEEPQPTLTLVSSAEGIPSSQRTATAIAPSVPKSPDVPSVALAFVQLLNLFQERKGTLLKWLGTKTYESLAKNQNRAGKIRKGAMLDERVE